MNIENSFAGLAFSTPQEELLALENAGRLDPIKEFVFEAYLKGLFFSHSNRLSHDYATKLLAENQKTPLQSIKWLFHKGMNDSECLTAMIDSIAREQYWRSAQEETETHDNLITKEDYVSFGYLTAVIFIEFLMTLDTHSNEITNKQHSLMTNFDGDSSDWYADLENIVFGIDPEQSQFEGSRALFKKGFFSHAYFDSGTLQNANTPNGGKFLVL